MTPEVREPGNDQVARFAASMVVGKTSSLWGTMHWKLINGAVCGLLLGMCTASSFAGYVLFGDGYVPQASDTFVQSDAGACCVGQFPTLTNNYIAQTFKATGNFPTALTLGLANNFGGSALAPAFKFRLLVVEAHSGFYPGTALWESGDLVIGGDVAGYKEYTFAISGLTLNAGSEYAWILDTFTTGAGTESAGAFFANIGHDAPAYSDGALYLQSSSGLGRDVDFVGTWLNSGFDAAFLIQYATSVPEPSSIALTIAALPGLLALRSRRRIDGSSRERPLAPCVASGVRYERHYAA